MFEVLIASRPAVARTVPQTIAVALVHVGIIAVVVQTTMLLAAPAVSLGGAAPRSPVPAGRAATYTGASAITDSPDYNKLGRTYTRWYLAGQIDSIVLAMHPETTKRLGGFAEIKRDIDAELLRMGPEVKLIAERFDVDSGVSIFEHEGQFRFTRNDTHVIRWRFAPDGRIVGMEEYQKSARP